MKKHLLLPAIFLLLSCSGNQENYDASGTFEADEIMVVAQANGTILQLSVEEGQTLKQNQIVGKIDPAQTLLQKEQIIATKAALEQKTNSALPQIQILEAQIKSQYSSIAILQEQLKNTKRERDRTANLVAKDAATRKQLDDADGQIAVINKQIATAQTQVAVLHEQVSAAKENVAIQNRAILSERQPTEKKIDQIDEQLKNNSIESPINGTVLTKYLNQGEFATTGKPLFKIADLENIRLKVYISGAQISALRIGQQVKVFVQGKEGQTKELPGVLYWISSQAEFTPKTIQTKDERANLVYAAKIKVKNDGYLKIGMYGDVLF